MHIFVYTDCTPSERLAAPALLRLISATQLPNGPSETEHGVFRYLGVSLLSGAKGCDLIRSDGLTWVSSEPRHRSQRGPENDRDGADLNHDPADHDLDPADRGQPGPENDRDQADLNHDAADHDLDPADRGQHGSENDRDEADLNHDAADHDLDPADRGQHGRETITMKACKS